MASSTKQWVQGKVEVDDECDKRGNCGNEGAYLFRCRRQICLLATVQRDVCNLTNLCAEGKLLAGVIWQTAAPPLVMLGGFGSGEVNLKKPSADVPFIWSFDERACGKVVGRKRITFPKFS